MQAIIKDGKSFKNRTNCTVVDYELTAESIYDDVSKISIVNTKTAPKEGDFITLDGGKMWVVDEIEPTANGAYEIGLRQAITLFSREIFYEPLTGSAEEQLAGLILDNFKNLNDTQYALQFLNVTTTTTTVSTVLPDVENGIYNIKSFAAKLRRLKNIFINFEAERGVLNVTIFKKNIPTKKIDFSQPDIFLEEVNFTAESVAKITTKAEDTGEIKDWYLMENGSVSNSPTTQGRAIGRWIVMNVSEAAQAENEVLNEFKKNSYSHQIKFSVPTERARFDFYDDLKISLDGKIFSSYIASKKIEKKSNRTTYQCGELRVSLTEKLKELI